MKKNVIFWGIFIFIGAIMVTRLTKGFVPLPVSLRHIIHLITQPHNFYEPIIKDKFLFYEKGFSKTYELKPKYFDIYDIGFTIDNTGVDSTYKFKGKIKVIFLNKEKILSESTITSMDSAVYAPNDMKHYRKISLLKFEMPLQNKYINDISVKLTVIDPDPELKKFSSSINLYIAPSSIP